MKINLNAPTVYQCEGVRLVPGTNAVDPDAAKKFMANPLVKADIDSGKLEVEKPKRGRPAASASMPSPGAEAE